MSWIKQILTGPDNETLAIGRVVGSAAAAVLLIGVPVVATASVLKASVPVDQWQTLFSALTLYVPAAALAVGGLIYGTNFTEPKPRHKDDDNG